MPGLLFDNNLSPRLPQELRAVYPDSVHVSAVGLERADDPVVWAYAQTEGYTIVTKDDDFRQLCFLYGPPPQVIWVRLGNCTTAQVATLLRERAAVIQAFSGDAAASLLILWPDRSDAG